MVKLTSCVDTVDIHMYTRIHRSLERILSCGAASVRKNRESQLYANVLQCAKEGYESTGVELNSILVAYSKYAAIKHGLRGQAHFRRRDIFKTDLQLYDTAVIFGAESLMGDLVPKLSEMRSGTSLLACRFPLPENPHWKEIAQIGEGIDAVWVYHRL